MEIKIRLVNERAIEPVQRPGDSGADLFATHDLTLAPGQRGRVDLGVAFEIPSGFGGFVMPRSGLASKGWIAHTGVIDSNFRGSVCATLENLTVGDTWTIKRGDRVAQICILPVPRVTFELCAELSETERAGNGFGSSGMR